MGEPLTPEEARAAAEKIDRTADRTRHLADPIAATLRAYADQAERLKEIEGAVGEYFRQNDEHARAMKAAIDAYHTDKFEGETKKAREASGKMDAAEARLRALQEK